MTSRPIGIGVIGCGKVAQAAHIPAFTGLDGARIVAVADLDIDLAEAVARRHGIPMACGDTETLLADPAIEAVVVVLPRPATGPTTLQCLAAGKHLLTEKPMCATAPQAERLLAAASTAKRRHIVGYMKRFDAGVAWAKATFDRLLADGSAGRLQFVRMHCYQGDDALATHPVIAGNGVAAKGAEWPMAPEWLGEEWHTPYHVYINRYSHDVNLLRHFLPAPLEVRAFRFTELFSQVALLEAGGVTVTLETGFNHFPGWDEVLEIYFERGRLVLKLPPPFLGGTPAQAELFLAAHGDRPAGFETPRIEPSWAFRRQAEAFVATLRDGTPSLAEAADAARDIALIEDIWRRVERTRP
jgi:predicted dehydrogenase